MQDIIVKKVRPYDMGYSLNHIQDVAEQVLTPKRWTEYLIASNADANECEGMDGILINGEYFDWKEFGPHKERIVRAYLRYFTDDELVLIANAL